MAAEIAIVRTGIANTASVIAAFERLGAAPRLTDDPAAVTTASHVVLPGVGAFGPAMKLLRECRLVEPLVERIRANRATLAICLGLQLLCESSEENPGERGLGVITAHVARFNSGLRVPQIGWNAIHSLESAGVLRSGYAYFANSFRLSAAPAEWNPAHADYGGPFVAAIERGSIVGCQFHPELSGQWGLDLLNRWVRGTAC